jgi:prolyl-tRNA editing enzyme YbaK/EbsC (Cys-tRNA(Pro) deacylase)
VIAGAAAEHFGVEPARVTRTLFAEAGTNRPVLGLARI